MRKPPQMGELKGPASTIQCRTDASKAESLRHETVTQSSGMELMDFGLMIVVSTSSKFIPVHWCLRLDPHTLLFGSQTSSTKGICSRSHIHTLLTLILKSTGWLLKYSSFCWLFFLRSENIHILRVRNAQTPRRLWNCSFPLVYFSQTLLFCRLCSFFLTLCYLTLSVDMITLQNLNNIFHLATITLGLCHICIFVHPSLHVCVTLVILGSMHGDPGCKAISSLLFRPLNPFSSLCWVCYWKGFWQEGLSWKLADSRLDSWIPTFTVGVLISG